MRPIYFLSLVFFVLMTGCDLIDEPAIADSNEIDMAADMQDVALVDMGADQQIAHDASHDDGSEMGPACQMGDLVCDGVCKDPNSVDSCGSCDTGCSEDIVLEPCEQVACQNMMCTTVDADDGTACDTVGGDSGQCVSGECVAACSEASDCDAPPTSRTECWEPQCVDGICTYDVLPDQPCGEGTCLNGVVSPPLRCGMNGECNQQGSQQSCMGFACNEAGDACRTNCASVDDCASGFQCIGAACMDELEITLATEQLNVVLTDELIAAGWDGTSAITSTITVPSGVDIGSTSVSTPSFLIDALPPGSSITLVVNGRILGAGGKGGDTKGTSISFTEFFPPEDGGTALEVKAQQGATVIEIDNFGTIAAGGGGGAPGYSKDDNDDVGCGGGGGAGFQPGLGGQPIGSLDEPDPGQPGTRSTGGAGGSWDRYAAGKGGDLGQPGGPATTSEVRGPTSAAGYYIIGNSNVIWNTVGTRLGRSRN